MHRFYKFEIFSQQLNISEFKEQFFLILNQTKYSISFINSE